MNALVIFPITERFNVSLGMGLGGAFTAINIDGLDGPIDFGFAYQGFGRFSYNLTRHLAVHAVGKVVTAPKTRFPSEAFEPPLEPLIMDGPLAVTGGCGVTYLF